jgi:hypothetical protein
MYLNGKNFIKDNTTNNNNRTMKRFRGGVEPQENQPTQMGAPPTDGPPTDGQQMGAPPTDGQQMGAPPMDGQQMGAPPTDGQQMDAPPTDEQQMDEQQMDAPPTDEQQMDGQQMDGQQMDEPPIVDESQSETIEEQAFVQPTGEGESGEIEAFRNMMGASPEAQQVYLYMNTNISTEENRDKSYKREGVLHFTDSVSVGADQKTIMSLGSVIGSRGIETTTYDKLRNVALQKVGILIGENRRCYNTKFDFERNGETILVHIYGTVYAKKENAPIL